MIILGGKINNSVYLGGKYSGLGSSDYLTNANITINEGVINGAIYGGSNINGILFGDVNMTISGGTINEIYGGGKNGSTNNNLGTFVTGNIIVNVGQNNTKPVINSIYGGSAYGVVNGLSISNDVSDKNINVNIYDGKITNVFGGAKGTDLLIPHILGKTVVNVSGGEIDNINRVEIPLNRHIGAPSVSIVNDGDFVNKGDLIAESGSGLSVPQHASISGVITLGNNKIIIDRIKDR